MFDVVSASRIKLARQHPDFTRGDDGLADQAMVECLALALEFDHGFEFWMVASVRLR